jgi:hypothetical protein
MKNTQKSKIIGLSVVTALLIGSGLNAGKIVSNATYDGNLSVASENAVVTQNTQFGFGGWNLDNVAVKIVSITDYATAVAGSLFDKITGAYAPTMTTGMSFESEISTGGQVRGLLHGKDWPVGEPAGIKVINGDLKAVANGDPANCIITTGYLDLHYLDQPVLTDRWPTICSSGFQTHKRFKINMLPTSVDVVDAEGYGKPIELVFNLEALDTSTQVYQVLQKINNYTGKILDGYKIEILDGNGAKNTNLTLSLDKDLPDLANFSHGLWGAPDNHFPDPGFFDDVGVYYPVALSADQQTISWHGAIAGGNYMQVFRSNWLHSTVAPQGIFFDDDNNALTDAKLVAFWGVPPTLPDTTAPGWYQGEVAGWAPVSQAQVDTWLLDSRYTRDTIEDVLNLGITYSVHIGDNTQIPTGKFIIRITPHIDGTVAPTPLPAVASSDGGGGGFDALDNVSLIAMILGFLGIGAFIARRKLAKQKI